MDHDVLLGLPLVGNADKEELRAFLVKRVPYALEDDELPQDLTALVDGAIPLVISWRRMWYWYDPLGGISEVNGISVIETADGFIYKADGTDLDIKSVLDRHLTEPPTTSVIEGDTYLIADGASGDWAGYDRHLAIYNYRGWNMIPPAIGDWVLVEDEDVYVRYTAAGTWQVGPGVRSFEENSIPRSALINVDPLIVENQTTDAPPVSPAVPVAYIIGPSPTGVWAGNAKKIAVCELDGSWTIYTPRVGQKIYDSDEGQDFRWNGTDWITASGNVEINIIHYTASTTYSKPARLIGIIVTVIGGGGGSTSSNGGGAGTGGTSSSFGAFLSATGGGGGDGATAATPGSGSGGDINRTGQPGTIMPAVANNRNTRPFAPFGSDRGYGGRATGQAANNHGDGAAGGGAQEWIAASDLAVSETVTVGTGGGNGSGATFESGSGGEVTIIEFLES